jgi:hypothetical protein
VTEASTIEINIDQNILVLLAASVLRKSPSESKNMKTFQIKLTDEAQAALLQKASRQKIEPDTLLQSVFESVSKKMLSIRSEDLTPKEAAIELNVSPHTAKRYFHQGKFPNAYTLNSRVIRIPRTDIADLKESRRLSVV